jgi:hypothetical protein
MSAEAPVPALALKSRVPVVAPSPAIPAPEATAPEAASEATASEAGAARSRSRLLAQILAFALAVRVASAALAFLANTVIPLDQREQFTVLGRTHAFWDTFARYDSGWYWGIARDGYHYVEGGRSNLAFFPVYPMAMRAAGELLGGRPRHYIFGGVLVSWLMSGIGLVMLYRLAREDLDADAAWRAVVLAAVFPFAFFFGVVYSESTFFALTVSACYGFRTRRWGLGGIAGALAVCSRVNGVLMLPVLTWLAWKATNASTVASRAQRLRAAAALAVVVAGFATWCGYVYALSGSPFEWASSITRWDYQPGGSPLPVLGGLVGALVRDPYTFLTQAHAGPYDTLNGLTALATLGIAPFVWRRFGAAYGLFMLLNLALPLSSGQLEGLGRYCSVLFPLPIWLASLRSQALHSGLVAISAMLYMLCLILFTTLHPIF